MSHLKTTKRNNLLQVAEILTGVSWIEKIFFKKALDNELMHSALLRSQRQLTDSRVRNLKNMSQG